MPCLAGFDRPGGAPVADRVCQNDYTASGARVSLRESLNRLGGQIPKVFGLRIHDPNDNSLNHRRLPPEGFVDEVELSLRPEEGMLEGLRQLRSEGEVEQLSLGMNCNKEPHQGVPDEILRLLRQAEPGTFQSALLAGGWNLESTFRISFNF